MDWFHVVLLCVVAASAVTSLVLHRRGSRYAAVADAALAGLQELEAGHPALDVAAEVAKSNAVHDLFSGMLNSSG